jgi:hypothetical protein
MSSVNTPRLGQFVHSLIAAVCAGSSTQIGVLVMPFCVILAWCFGQPLDLNFNGEESSLQYSCSETTLGLIPLHQQFL